MQIAKYLSDKGIKSRFYHAGLSYYKKEQIEKDFAKGKLDAVVTTAALSAGVDFPASQVIFETLLMGTNWISPNEFSQMLGRAGRPSYHDRGIVYLLPEIGKQFEQETEESVALTLLESDTEDVNIIYDEEDLKEQILADISSNAITTIKELEDSLNKAPIETITKEQAEEIKKKQEDLMKAAEEVYKKAYEEEMKKQQAAGGGQAGAAGSDPNANAGGNAGGSTQGNPGDDVVDGDFKEV